MQCHLIYLPYLLTYVLTVQDLHQLDTNCISKLLIWQWCTTLRACIKAQKVTRVLLIMPHCKNFYWKLTAACFQSFEFVCLLSEKLQQYFILVWLWSTMMSASVFVRLHNSKSTRPDFTKFMHYVLPVLRMTSSFRTMGPMGTVTHGIVWFTVWQCW